MAETKARRLAAALDEFISSSPDVEAAAVVSFDGLPMASALPDSMEEDRVGAMSAALLSLGEQAALGLGRGQLNQVFIEGEHGYVFLMSARDQAVLAAVARHSAKIGFMLFEMRRAAEQIGLVLLSTEHPEHRSEPFEQRSEHPDHPEHPEPAENPEPAGHVEERSGFDEPSWIDEPQWSAPDPGPQEQAHQQPPQQDADRQDAARQDAADHDAVHQEPAPWSSQIPQEHDLSSGPVDEGQPEDEFPHTDDSPTYRHDEDRTAAPWQ